jgi:hypothetical protein
MLEKPRKKKELKFACKGAKVICKDLHLFSHLTFDKKEPTFLVVQAGNLAFLVICDYTQITLLFLFIDFVNPVNWVSPK